MGKTRKLINDVEAKALGIYDGRKPQKNKQKARYRLTDEQLQKLDVLRNEYTPLSVIGKSTLKDSDGNVIIEWTKTSTTQEDKLKALRTAVETLKEEIPKELPKKYIFKESNKNLINQYTLTDYHLGMMAWDEETGSNWDIKIAEDTLVKFFNTAIQLSPNAEECIFAQIGDFLHWDGLDAVTPQNKHILDADTRFTKLVRTAIRVIRRVIDLLLQKYKVVRIIMAEGNHDPASSVWLREMLSSFYENENRVIIDTNPDPYYCINFGSVCLFYHHGHKRNVSNIDTVFVSKFKKEFSTSDFVYAHLGHLHNEKLRETNLMLIEQHRTLASKDAYSSRGGWMSGRDSKIITYHKDFGEVGRSTINIKMLE